MKINPRFMKLDPKELMELMDERRQQRFVQRIYENLSLRSIFLLWVFILLVFGGIYYLFSTDSSYITYATSDANVTLTDHFYFSFITATSTGFGDIVPKGFFKILAIFEVIMGLTLFAMVTSKLVSIKQDNILSEIYDIAYYEKINRLRNALYLFRVDTKKILAHIRADEYSDKNARDLWIHLSQLRNTLEEVKSTIAAGSRGDYLRKVDDLDVELILYSTSISFKRVLSLLSLLSEKEIYWRSDPVVRILQSVLKQSDQIVSYFMSNHSSDKAKEHINDIQTRANDIRDKFFHELMNS